MEHEKTKEEIIKNIAIYTEISEPYIKLLAKISSFKMPIVILNIGTNEMKVDYGNDLPIETEIKKHLKSLREYFEK